MGLRSSGPEQRADHERHERAGDHVHHPNLSGTPPSGSMMSTASTTNAVNAACPDGERQGAARVGGDEDEKGKDDPCEGIYGADDPQDRDRGNEPGRRPPDCCDRRPLAGEHAGTQDGEGSERDPEPMREVADPRNEHREADGDTSPQRVAKPHRAHRQVGSQRLPCASNRGRVALRDAPRREVSPPPWSARSADRRRRVCDSEGDVRQQTKVALPIHAVEDPVCALVP